MKIVDYKSKIWVQMFRLAHKKTCCFILLYAKTRQNKEKAHLSVHFSYLVPPGGIEPPIDPYHGSVIPLN